jgi:hypothetical protein
MAIFGAAVRDVAAQMKAVGSPFAVQRQMNWSSDVNDWSLPDSSNVKTISTFVLQTKD